jgi:hypothetical protein
MLLRLWKFAGSSENRAILSWLGGGAIVVVSGVWVAYVYLHPAQKDSEPRAGVQAKCGSVAINGPVSGATITAGTTTNSDCSTTPPQGSVR